MHRFLSNSLRSGAFFRKQVHVSGHKPALAPSWPLHTQVVSTASLWYLFTLLKEHVFVFAHGHLSLGTVWVLLSVKFTSLECGRGGLTLFLVAMAFKMVLWAGLSSPLTGRLHPAGSGSRWLRDSCCFTCYSGRLELASLMCATLTCPESPSKVTQCMVSLS